MTRPPLRPLPRPTPATPGPDQESVWDYPRPAIAQHVRRRIRVIFAGKVIADAPEAFRVIETSHPPTYYVPPDAVDRACLKPSGRRTLCEWKGAARYFNLDVNVALSPDAAWAYDQPTAGFRDMSGWIAFYPRAVDEAWVDGRRVTPQPGFFYGGWVTPDVVGPFKGEPGSEGW